MDVGGVMKNVDINLGKACNNSCLFCSNGQATPEEKRLSKVDDVEREIAALRKMGFESIGFLGGEPCLHPQLERLLATSRDLGFRRIAIITNGSKLSHQDQLLRLLDAGLTRVALSIHSHSERTEDAITGRCGVFAEKMAAIHHLVEAQQAGRLPDGFSLNTVLHKKNVLRLVPFAREMAKAGVTDIRFNFIRPTLKAKGSRAWVPTFKITTPQILKLIQENEARLGLSLSFADVPLCKMPWAVLSEARLRGRYIGENRDLETHVTEMRDRASAEIPEGKIRFNWKEKRMRFKTYLSACASCPVFSQCEGVWEAYLDIHGRLEFAAAAAVVRASLAER